MLSILRKKLLPSFGDLLTKMGLLNYQPNEWRHCKDNSKSRYVSLNNGKHGVVPIGHAIMLEFEHFITCLVENYKTSLKICHVPNVGNILIARISKTLSDSY